MTLALTCVTLSSPVKYHTLIFGELRTSAWMICSTIVDLPIQGSHAIR